MIEVKNVSKIFGKKQNAFTALDNVSFSIADGATVAIVGKSGSGKSTLMHVISGLDRASQGSIKVGRHHITNMSAKDADSFRATEMSFIFQSFFVEANQSCLNNVMLPLEIAKVPTKERQKMALRALEVVELSEKANQKAKNLSGGQKQRLAIARAIVNSPKLIFADEPTGNLDSITGEKVMSILFEINKKLGTTLIIVTHDEELAGRCQQKIFIKDGHVDQIDKQSPVKGKK